MTLTYKELIASLKEGKYQPVYMLTGEEGYFIDLVSDYFEEHTVDPSFRDFDQTVLYGYGLEMSDVVANAKQFPMMSPVRLLMVKEAQLISAKPTDTKEWEKLIPYLENPMPQTVLVICYRNGKPDKRLKAFKTIYDKYCVCESNKLYDSQLPEWIGTFANQQGHAITQRGAMLIAESIGNNLSKIANEIEKLCICIKPGDNITEEIIERYIGISKDYNVFELQNAIGRRDVVKCNRIVNHFAANPKDNPIQMVLPSLYNYFIKLMIYLQLPDKTKAASVLKINNYFVKDYVAAANNYSLGKLASCIGYLYDADLRSKGIHNNGSVTDGELLKELVFKIIH